MADLTFRPDIIVFLIYNSRQMQERRALPVYIWTETLPSLFFPFTLATTRISWSGRGGCFKHEWSKWRHQTEFSRKSGVVFSLKTLLTHTYTQSSKAVSGGKKKHGGDLYGWVSWLFLWCMRGRWTQIFHMRTDKNHTTAAADRGDASLLWKPCWLILTHRAPQATDQLTASA